MLSKGKNYQSGRISPNPNIYIEDENLSGGGLPVIKSSLNVTNTIQGGAPKNPTPYDDLLMKASDNESLKS